MNPTATVEKVTLDNASTRISLKIRDESYELTIWLSKNCIDKLKNIENMPWDDGSIKVGKSAGSDVFWACEEEIVSILIGGDDEAWDIGFFVPLELLNDVISEIENL